LRIRIRPVFSTMNSRPLPSGALVTNTGFDRPVATGARSTEPETTAGVAAPPSVSGITRAAMVPGTGTATSTASPSAAASRRRWREAWTGWVGSGSMGVLRSVGGPRPRGAAIAVTASSALDGLVGPR
jgi:hypothetical protein